MNSQHDQREKFDQIVISAFEFLLKAIDEIRESPKFSTIHFASSIELFLKARLMVEHWSLVVDRLDNTKKSDFYLGKSKTVTPDTAFKRLGIRI